MAGSAAHEDLADEVGQLFERVRGRTLSELAPDVREQMEPFLDEDHRTPGHLLGVQLCRQVVARRHGYESWSEISPGDDTGMGGGAHPVDILSWRSFEEAGSHERTYVGALDLVSSALRALEADQTQHDLHSALVDMGVTRDVVERVTSLDYGAVESDATHPPAPTPRWYGAVAAAKTLVLTSAMSAETAVIAGVCICEGLDPVLDVAGVDPASFLERIGVEFAQGRTIPPLGGTSS